jgi:hypothetical protein
MNGNFWRYKKAIRFNGWLDKNDSWYGYAKRTAFTISNVLKASAELGASA